MAKQFSRIVEAILKSGFGKRKRHLCPEDLEKRDVALVPRNIFEERGTGGNTFPPVTRAAKFFF